jgi:plastocyanin
VIRRAAALLVFVGVWFVFVPANAAETHTATIASFNYTPSDVQIHVGDTVVWRNVDPTVHTVTASRGEFVSGSMRQGQTFAVRFNAAGAYPYFCEPHEFMRGTVSVYGSGAATSAPSTTSSTAAPSALASPTTVVVVTAPPTTIESTTTTTGPPRFVVGAVRGDSEQPSPVVPVLATLALAAVFGVAFRRRAEAARYLAVAATLASGALHLQLRLVLDYPEPIGTLLVIEAGGAAVLAAWLAAGPLTARKGAVAIGAHVAALAALGVTRTSVGLFGFHEFGWDPSPQLPLAVALGAVAIAALAVGTVLRSVFASPDV